MAAPKKKTHASPSPQLAIRLSPEERAEIEAAAKRVHPSLAASAWAREVLLQAARDESAKEKK